MLNYWNDLLHCVSAYMTKAEGHYLNQRTGEYKVTQREIWENAPRAAARKATAEGVNHLCIDNQNGKFFIFQVSGYTKDRGLFCDLLDESGRVIA